MRIGIDGRSLLELEPSGVSVYTRELIKNLAPILPASDSLEIFLSGLKIPFNIVDEFRALPRTTIHQLHWSNKIFHAAALLGHAPTIDQYLGGVDVLFVPNLHVVPVQTHIPLVVTVHDLSFHYYPHFLSWRRKLWHHVVRPAKLFHQARQLIAVSQATADAVTVEYNVPVERVTVILSGQPVLVAPETVSHLPEHFIVAVGTLEPRKNLQTLLAAFQKYHQLNPQSNLHLVIVGSAGWKSDALRQQLYHHPMIHYLGYVSPAQKTAVIQRAAALLYPSLYEGFGFPPLEALELQTPVVVGRAGALPEVLQHSARYINPYSQQEIRLALALFDQHPRYQTLNQPGDWKQLNWQRTAEATLQVLRDAVY